MEAFQWLSELLRRAVKGRCVLQPLTLLYSGPPPQEALFLQVGQSIQP